MTAWEAVSAEFSRIINGNNDAIFYTQLQRARSEAITFAGYYDIPPMKSQVDIGDFIRKFQSLCIPGPDNGELDNLLNAALVAYDNMFITRRNGYGTPAAATGMHMTWPTKRDYKNTAILWDVTLLNQDHPHFTKDAPQFSAFLIQFLASSTPYDQTSMVCDCSQADIPSAQREGQLLVNPSISVDGNTSVTLTSKVVEQTDFVLIEYALDFTELFFGDDGTTGGNNRHSRLLQSINKFKHHRHKLLSPDKDKIVQSHQDHSRFESHRRKKLINNQKPQGRRRASEVNRQDYFLLYGGDISPIYGCADFRAEWDQNFRILADGSQSLFETVYAIDDGDGAGSIPVLYFSDSLPVELQDPFLFYTLTIEDAVAAGASRGYLSYFIGPGEPFTQNFILFTESPNGLSETPPSAGGYIMPIVYVEGVIAGETISYILGGFANVFSGWNINHSMTIGLATRSLLVNQLPSVDSSLIDVMAVDFDVEPFVEDFYAFVIGDTTGQSSAIRVLVTKGVLLAMSASWLLRCIFY